MSATQQARAPLRFRWMLFYIILAAVCFHVAYSASFLGIAIVGYLCALIQLARAPTGRQAFYSGLAAGLLTVAPQLICLWRIFGFPAIVLWLVLAFWIGLFVALTHLCLMRFRPAIAAVLIVLVWTGLEYFRSELYYLRFSWLNVGYAFGGAIPLLPIRTQWPSPY